MCVDRERKETGTSTQHSTGTGKEQAASYMTAMRLRHVMLREKSDKRGTVHGSILTGLSERQISPRAAGSRPVGPVPGVLLPDCKEARGTLGGRKVLSWLLLKYLC